MNQRGISLGRVLGIPIRLDLSWFLVFALVAWTLAAGYFPAEFKNWSTVQYWVVGIVTAVFFFVSVILHELGHSVVARHYKIAVRSISLFVFGGVSQIEAEPPTARVEFLMATAGPAVSFVLAAIFGLLQLAPALPAPVLAVAKYLAFINVALGLFNLIPGFPLDGGRVFRSVIWGTTRSLRRATTIAGNLGRFIGYLFILVGVYLVIRGNWINGLWITFIGWFLESAAMSQVQQQRIHDLLAGRRVSQAMSTTYTAIPPDISVQELVDKHILGSGQRSFVVQEGDRVVGLLTMHCVKELPRAEWPTTPASQVMIPLAQLKRTTPETELWAAMDEMNRDGVNQLPVMADSRILGMLRRGDIISYLRSLREVGA